MKNNNIVVVSPEQVKELINNLGMKVEEFLDHTCGVSYNTFAAWAQKKRISNDAARILFTYIQNHPEIIPELREIRKQMGEMNE